MKLSVKPPPLPPPLPPSPISHVTAAATANYSPQPKKKLSKHSLLGKKYAPGDYTDVPVFKPPEGDEISTPPQPYGSVIISNSVDYRLRSSPDLTAELRLQCMARDVHRSVLVALLNARPPVAISSKPPAQRSLEKPHTETARVVEGDKEEEADSVAMLCTAVERLLSQAANPAPRQPSIDVVATLELWHEANLLLDGCRQPGSVQSEPLDTATPTPSRSPPVPPVLVCSDEAVSLLLDCLLSQPSPSASVWQHGLAILKHLFAKQHEGVVRLNLDPRKLLEVFAQLFQLEASSDPARVQDSIVSGLLKETAMMVFSGSLRRESVKELAGEEEGEGEGEDQEEVGGVELLLAVLVRLLEER